MPANDSVYINIIADATKAIAGIAKLGAAFYAVNKIFKTVIRIGSDLIESYKEQEQAEAKLTAALRATGKQYDISLRGLADYASELQTLTTYGDEATISAMAMLQQLGDLDEDGLRKLTPLVQDFATAMGVDLQTAASLVGKTLGSSTNALSRYGVQIDATAPKEAKLAALTEVLQKKFGGFSELVAQTGTGALDQLNNIMSDIKEEGGKALLELLKPAIVSMTNFLTRTLQAWSAQRNLNIALKGEASSVYEVDQALKLQVQRLAEAASVRTVLEKQVQNAQVAYDKEAQKVRGGTAALSSNLAQATMNLQNLKDRLAAQERLVNEGRANIATLKEERSELQKMNDVNSARVKLLKAQEEATADAAEAEAAYFKLLGEYATTAYNQMSSEAVGWTDTEAAAFLAVEEIIRAHNKLVGEDAVDAIRKAKEEAEAFAEKTMAAIAPFADAIGMMAIDSKKGWEMFADAAKDAIATVLEMLAKQAFTYAAIQWAKVLALDFTALPGAIAWTAAGTAALVAAGAVKAMAEGGVVTRPTTALIGEAGPEAVIPLNKMEGMGTRVTVNVYGSVMEEEGLARKIGSIVSRQRRGY